MAKPDEKAPARLTAYLDDLLTWLDALGAHDTALAERTRARLADRRERAPRLTPPLAEQAELGAWHDAYRLAERLGIAPAPTPRPVTAGLVRATLRRLELQHPGRLVEVRVPPFAAVQIGRPGVTSVHRRGTPPNVVETDAQTWLLMVVGELTWAEALGQARVSASGAHAQLDDVVPLA